MSHLLGGTNSHKKAKKMQEDASLLYQTRLDQLNQVRDYILSCKEVPLDCEAIQVTLKALDACKKKTIRDETLRQKFASMEQPMQEDDEEEEEWLDVTKPQEEEEENVSLLESTTVPPAAEVESSSLGRSLAERSVQLMAAATNVGIGHPMAGLALLLHGALVSDVLQFKCTGIPDSSPQKSKFAAPIRELPKHEFVPKQWDAHVPNYVTLRYRKDGYGTAILHVTLEEGEDVQIYFGPPKNELTPNFHLPLDQHMNLESFQTASSSSSNKKVSPLLHFKSTSTFLSNFTNSSIDLGQIHHHPDNEDTLIPPDYSYASYQPPSFPTNTTTTPSFLHPPNHYDAMRQPNTRLPHPEGDFQSDLHPTFDPLMVRPNPTTGNLMGPNHPLFQQDNHHHEYAPPGLGMQPRFDPVYPPGVAGRFPTRGRGRGRGRHNLGDPNPDHQRLPNNFNHDGMFM